MTSSRLGQIHSGKSRKALNRRRGTPDFVLSSWSQSPRVVHFCAASCIHADFATNYSTVDTNAVYDGHCKPVGCFRHQQSVTRAQLECVIYLKLQKASSGNAIRCDLYRTKWGTKRRSRCGICGKTFCSISAMPYYHRLGGHAVSWITSSMATWGLIGGWL